MQNELSNQQNILNENGKLKIQGWFKETDLLYNKADIKKSLRRRIKEFDEYVIYNNNFAIKLSISDGYNIGFVTVTIIDFNKQFKHTVKLPKLFTKGKFNMPSSPNSGDTTFSNNSIGINFSRSAEKHFLKCEFVNFYNVKNLYVNISLKNNIKNTISMATPMGKDDKYFYYGKKVLCMSASGVVRCGGDEYIFSGSDSFAVFNWGRGIMPYKSNILWGCTCGFIQKSYIGINFGNNNTSNSINEDAVFYDGNINKIDNISITKLNEKSKNKINISSADKKVNLTFEPIIKSYSKISSFTFTSQENLIFGYYSGNLILNNKKNIKIKNLLGFLNNTKNKW